MASPTRAAAACPTSKTPGEWRLSSTFPHYVFNFTDEFESGVVEPYVAAYAAGRTPNPCVECNRSMKFGRLLERADALGFDFLATGHHARVGRAADGSYVLRRGVDRAKDQSYVLYMLGQRELARTLLPVGELTKAEVRAHAGRLGLRTAEKAESMDVCFITRGGPRGVPRRADRPPVGSDRRHGRYDDRCARRHRELHRRSATRARRRRG